MPETIRAPGAYPDAPDASDVPPPPEPTLDELADAKKAAEEALAEAQALGNPTLINRALAALDAAQRAYDEALAEADGRRTRLPWPYGPTRGSREELPSDQPTDTQQQLPAGEKKEDSSAAMWWAVGLLAAAGIAGVVWYSRKQTTPVRNPYPPRRGRWMTKASAEAQWKSWYLPDVIDWEKRNHGGKPESHMRLASWNDFLKELVEEGKISKYHADHWGIPKEVGW